MSEDKQFKLLRSKLLDLKKPALLELMRITSSEVFMFMTDKDIVAVGDYHPISIMGKAFFEAPFSTGKDVATVLRLAWSLGQDVVRKELYGFAGEWAELEKIFSSEGKKASEQT